MLVDKQLIQLNQNGKRKLAFECNLCIFNFDTRADRNAHVKTHFDRKLCTGCDKWLIEIGDEWFELRPHEKTDCNPNNTTPSDGDFIFNPHVVKLEEIHHLDVKVNESNISKQSFEGELTADGENTHQLCNAIADNAIISQDDKSVKEKEIVTTTQENETDHIASPLHSNQWPSDEDLLTEDNGEIDVDLPLYSEQKKLCKCKYCIQVFSSLYSNSYEKHLQKIHKDFAEFDVKCRSCKLTFTNRSDYLTHTEEVHKKKLCTLCGKLLKNCSYQSHLLTVHKKGEQLICATCKKTFWTKKSLTRHLKIHGSKFQPNQPEDISENHKKILLQARKKGTIECEFCHEITTTLNYKRHLNKVHKYTAKCYKCQICDDTFTEYTKYKKHIDDIHDGIKVRCRICNKAMINEFRLKRHMFIHKSAEQRVCPHCSKEFKTEAGMSQHMAIHENASSFKCKECNKEFKKQTSLNLHVSVVHRGKEPSKCEVCKKCFPSTANLKTHMAIHSDFRPFICNYCAKGFLSKYNLEQHINIHTGQKPYSCTICQKKFSQKGLLSAHKRIHTREKIFKCKVGDCDRVFMNGIDATRHRFSAHGVYTKKHICEICSAVFPEKLKLRKHMEKH